ncbi:MAG: hypothetical protein AAF829_00350 [Pseudomonadota bacterium]
MSEVSSRIAAPESYSMVFQTAPVCSPWIGLLPTELAILMQEPKESAMASKPIGFHPGRHVSAISLPRREHNYAIQSR